MQFEKLKHEPDLDSTITLEEFEVCATKALAKLTKSVNALLLQKSILVTKPTLLNLWMLAKLAEDFIDGHNVNHCQKWRTLRKLIGAIRYFSDLGYILRHLYFWSSRHQIDRFDEFSRDTDEVLSLVDQAFHRALNAYQKEIKNVLGDSKIDSSLSLWNWTQDSEDNGYVKSDIVASGKAHEEETVIGMATTFLNIAEDNHYLSFHKSISADDLDGVIPNKVNEKKLGDLEQTFHSHQTMYDTYIAGTLLSETEEALPHLRGLISILYHISEAAGRLSHFYERHQKYLQENTEYRLWEKGSIEKTMVFYFVSYLDYFTQKTRSLCQSIISKYTTINEIELPIPSYRGFHVRPSTFISKIVTHYGSSVKMQLNNHTYDTSSPMDLFRANEEINQQKRRLILKMIFSHPSLKENREGIERKVVRANIFSKIRRIVFFWQKEEHHNIENILRGKLREVFLILWEEKKLCLYDSFSTLIESIDFYEDESFYELVKRTVISFQAQGMLDIDTKIVVKFIGDQRALSDIKVLAKSGYGEDSQGNNVELPRELKYLRR